VLVDELGELHRGFPLLGRKRIKLPAYLQKLNMLLSNLGPSLSNPPLRFTLPRLPLVCKSPLPVRTLLRNDLTQRIREAVRQPYAAHTAVLPGG
jgi:hypothetical protein